MRRDVTKGQGDREEGNSGCAGRMARGWSCGLVGEGGRRAVVATRAREAAGSAVDRSRDLWKDIPQLARMQRLPVLCVCLSVCVCLRGFVWLSLSTVRVCQGSRWLRGERLSQLRLRSRWLDDLAAVSTCSHGLFMSGWV